MAIKSNEATADFSSSKENRFNLNRWIAMKIMKALNHAPIRLHLWDGTQICGKGQCDITVDIRDRAALLRLAANPEFEFGEMYTAERIRVHGDLPKLIEIIYRALPRQKNKTLLQKALYAIDEAATGIFVKAAKNARHHYDLSNDFYRLWLDEAMSYTCAYFPTQEASLEAAQFAKFEHICQKLQLKPGETVIETGCGWGVFALHMAKHYGVTVRAYNVSLEQLAFAREEAKRQQLDHLVTFTEADYRHITGEADVYVSVGMLEHVGVENYKAMGEAIDRCLKPNGRGLIHSIGRDYPNKVNPWIEKYIFPGACPPTISQFMGIFEPFEFSVTDIENIRLHYALTLKHWLQRYEDAQDEIEYLFDHELYLTWRLYLAGSLAAFSSGRMQLYQVMFNRTGQNDLPWTRDYLYPGKK